MNARDRLLDLLPPPYAVAADSTLAQFLEVFAIELDAYQEDLDRLRRTHWIRQAYRLTDAEKLGALLDIPPLPWEGLDSYRVRLLALAEARLAGALGPAEIKQFVYSYLRESEDALDCIFVPGLAASMEAAYEAAPARPGYLPLGFVENPPKSRRSAMLAARGGVVPYLYRWREENRGLEDTLAVFHVTGLLGKRTTAPVLVNLTTGELIGYRGVVPAGKTLSLRPNPSAQAPRRLTATLDGSDVSHSVFSVQGVSLGVPFREDQRDPEPLAPRLVRGVNEWIFLSIGLYDLRGLDRFFFALASQELKEGVFDQSSFNASLFPSGAVAGLAMEWMEAEPAAFEVRVPRHVVAEPGGASEEEAGPLHRQVALGLEQAIAGLHAAGVRAEVQFVPFVERQPQAAHVQLPWLVLDRELGPAGRGDEVDVGGRFGETPLGGTRFE